MEIVGAPIHYDEYSPISSHSATLAPPSTETDHTPIMPASETFSQARRGSGLQQYTALGQLKYAPATQTTVVTTTTTTTTSFPPLMLKAPRHLYNRDPKQYPLAASPTPDGIKNFSFDVDGRPVWFSETEDLEGPLLELEQHHNILQQHNGTIRSITSYDTIYETPKRTYQARPHLHTTSMDHLTKPASPKKRPAENPILLDAAERALEVGSKRVRSSNGADGTPNLQRRYLSKSRLSQSFDETALVTPDTGGGQHKAPRLRTKLRKVEPSSTPKRDAEIADMIATSSRSRRAEVRQEQSELPRPRIGESSFPAPPMSTTPPMADDDLELVDSLGTPANQMAPHRPTLIDTLMAQDASLPSPSLSPITAAANLARSNAQQDNTEEADDGDDVSSLDIAQKSSKERREERKSRMLGQSRIEIPTGSNTSGGTNPQLPTPTLMDIPTMLDSFDGMPTELQTYVMYQMLRRCNKTTLHLVADVVNPALKCDFLALLPMELSMNVVKYLDVKTMCRAAQVSKKWRQLVDSNETAWKELLEEDGLVVPEGEMQRAVKEGWGWQIPEEEHDAEVDLSGQYGVRIEEEGTSPASSTAADSEYSAPQSASRPKRKANGRIVGLSKKRKTKAALPSIARNQIAPWAKSLEGAHGPRTYSDAAMMAVPNPDVGMSSLRNLHLYKSIYRRHYAIKKGWMEEETQPHHIAFRAHGRHVVTCLQFDSEKIITGSDDTRIHVYDTKTGREIKQLVGHEGGVWALQYDGNILVSGSTDRSVRVWDLEKGKCIQQFLGHTSTVRCLTILKPVKIGEDEYGQPIMMPKEPLIITGSRDSSLRVWKLPAPGERSVIQTGHHAQDHENPYFIRALMGHHHSVRAIAAHGDTLVSGSYDSSVRVWKISTGDLSHRLTGHTAKVYSVVLDHERARCISGSMDNTVRIWSVETGQQLFHLEGHTSLVGLLDLGHNRLVSAAADSTLRIWDPDSGQCKNTLTAHTGAITCFQHDDQKVISGSDRTLKLWNVKSGECVKDLLTDLSGVWQVKFNERRCVAAVQRDNLTYIEVLDFGAARDGIVAADRGRRIVVDRHGEEAVEHTESDDAANALS